MPNPLNNLKIKITTALAALVLLVGCFQDPVSTTRPNPPVAGDVQLNLHMAVGSVNSLSKGNLIVLNKLAIVFTSNATVPDTVRDTISVGQNNFSNVSTADQPVNKNYTLKSLRTWKVIATVIDTRGMIIHRDSAITPTLYSADTAAISLNLSSRYAMYDAHFVTIPDSITSASGGLKQKLNLNRLVLWIDGVKVRDSSVAPGNFASLVTHSLEYDYVLTGTKGPVVNQGSQAINAVHMIDGNVGVAVGANGWARRTTDGGVTWNTMAFSPAGPGTRTLRAVSFINATHGWMAGDSTIYRTTDGGLNWARQTSFSHTFGLGFSGVAFINPARGTAVSLTGLAYRTTDSGQTWTLGSSYSHFTGVRFAQNDSVGWIVGTANNGHVSYSTNGGTSWINSGATFAPSLGASDTLRAVYGVNRNFAVVVGTGGKIYRSLNGGLNWTAASVTGTTQRLNAVWFLDTAVGFAVGDNGTLVSTNNGGLNWAVETTPTTQRLTGISFSGGSGLVTGTNGTVFSIKGPRLVEMYAYGPMGNWNTANPLFAGSKYISVLPGQNVTIPLTLNWVGPTTGTGSISATLGRVGKVTIIGTLPGSTP